MAVHPSVNGLGEFNFYVLNKDVLQNCTNMWHTVRFCFKESEKKGFQFVGTLEIADVVRSCALAGPRNKTVIDKVLVSLNQLKLRILRAR